LKIESKFRNIHIGALTRANQWIRNLLGTSPISCFRQGINYMWM